MQMSDLTVVFLTANRVPRKWANFHKDKLLEAIEDSSLITISYEPLDFGFNLLQTEYSTTNIFRQILRGVKLATTPYIAIAEDDTLYSKEHFQFRPDMDKFGYNLSRWGVFTWGKPLYYFKNRCANSAMIASRELVIEALERRFSLFPEELPWYMTKELGTSRFAGRHNKEEVQIFYTNQPIVTFDHEFSIDRLNKTHRKRPGEVQCYDIPLWGRVRDLRRKFTWT